jgi:uncharacterized protein YkwD
MGGPADPTPDSAATFTFAASEPALLASFECRLDAAPWVSCSSPRRLDGLSGGRHRFEVRLTGPVANPTPAGRDWTVELQSVATPGAPPTPGSPPPAALNPAPVAPVRGDGGCPDGGARPGQVAGAALARAVLCLLDHERRLRGLRPLRPSAPLMLAARRHARDMVRRRYFAHVSPAGATLGDRVARTGYLRGASGWSLGEVLAWTDRARATPGRPCGRSCTAPRTGGSSSPPPIARWGSPSSATRRSQACDEGRRGSRTSGASAEAQKSSGRMWPSCNAWAKRSIRSMSAEMARSSTAATICAVCSSSTRSRCSSAT